MSLSPCHAADSERVSGEEPFRCAGSSQHGMHPPRLPELVPKLRKHKALGTQPCTSHTGPALGDIPLTTVAPGAAPNITDSAANPRGGQFVLNRGQGVSGPAPIHLTDGEQEERRCLGHNDVGNGSALTDAAEPEQQSVTTTQRLSHQQSRYVESQWPSGWSSFKKCQLLDMSSCCLWCP